MQVQSEAGMQALWLRHIATGRKRIRCALLPRAIRLNVFSGRQFLYFCRRDEEEKKSSHLVRGTVLAYDTIGSRDRRHPHHFFRRRKHFSLLARETRTFLSWDLVVAKRTAAGRSVRLFREKIALERHGLGRRWSRMARSYSSRRAAVERAQIGGSYRLQCRTARKSISASRSIRLLSSVWPARRQGVILRQMIWETGAMKRQNGIHAAIHAEDSARETMTPTNENIEPRRRQGRRLSLRKARITLRRAVLSHRYPSEQKPVPCSLNWTLEMSGCSMDGLR